VAVELPEDNCLLSALKSLSSDQLIGIIGQIVIDHPNIEKVHIQFNLKTTVYRCLFYVKGN